MIRWSTLSGDKILLLAAGANPNQDPATAKQGPWVISMTQPYGDLPPHQKHSATSRAAAASIKKKIGPLHQRVLDYLDNHPDGAFDEQLGDDLHMPMNTLRPRRRELQLMGRVKDSGRIGYTKSGSAAVIWVKA